MLCISAKMAFLYLSVDDSLPDDLNSEGQRSDQASWIKTDHCTGSALLSPLKTCVEFNFNGWHCWLDSLCRKPWYLEAHHRWLGVAFALFLDHKGRVCVYVCVQSSSAGDLKGFFDSVWLLTVRTWNISFVADVHMCLWVCVYVWVSVECVIILCASERNARLFLMLINVCQNRVTMSVWLWCVWARFIHASVAGCWLVPREQKLWAVKNLPWQEGSTIVTWAPQPVTAAGLTLIMMVRH